MCGEEPMRRWRQAWAQGEVLSLTEGGAYARRGRGERRRPQSGMASLTPVESQVAQLVAAGMTNPQIAAAIFVSRGTVKMHLSSIYRKLDVRGRVELAAAITRWGAEGVEEAPPREAA
jgi:DNA-binding CsgD family transcriptional regulator